MLLKKSFKCEYRKSENTSGTSGCLHLATLFKKIYHERRQNHTNTSVVKMDAEKKRKLDFTSFNVDVDD